MVGVMATDPAAAGPQAGPAALTPISADATPANLPPGDGGDPARLTGEAVYERLRQMIVRLDLVPGAVIDRADLQARFGVSSTPLRDALLRLAREGLVDIVPQSATRVSLIDLAAVRQAQVLRRGVEQEAVRLLAGAAERDFVPELQLALAAQLDRAEAGDVAGFAALDDAFHRRLLVLAGAPDLFDLVRRHSGQLDRIRQLQRPVAGRMREVVREHGRILKSIAAGNPDKAQARMRDHLAGALAPVHTLQAEHPQYFRG
ncbi:FCD domain-containing protein [Rhodoplanes serenus]|uniref:FCD domain-containing protein n=2 Tax=Rhodoplanes serenus TaxID=200615 RepID=A0A9X5ASJ5_9BRAD|nr:FCD domain-containing protein [Rhodoplanes serenus]